VSKITVNNFGCQVKFYQWRCPSCGGRLEDIAEIKEEDMHTEIAYEMTGALARYHCLQCDYSFGEKELKDKISGP